MIITGCVAFAKHNGAMRVEAELMPQCWEQVSSLPSDLLVSHIVMLLIRMLQPLSDCMPRGFRLDFEVLLLSSGL